MKKAARVLLAALLIAPPGDVTSAPELSIIRGAVTVSSRPLSGIALAFIDITSGSVYRTTSTPAGSYEARVPAGRYVMTTENPAGLVVSRAPSVIAVSAGQVATADVDLAPIPGANTSGAGTAPQEVQPPIPPLPGDPPSALTATQIQHDPIGCVIEGQFPLFEAVIEPAASVARARVYFRAVGSDAWYYVEMTPATPGFVGKLPRPKLEASPITYYIQATTTEFGESQTPEYETIVVADARDCPEDRKVAAIGPPGEVTVFSAATGSAIAPVGFAAGGLALTAGTIALLLGGAAAVGIGTVVVLQPSPSPTATPTPIAVASPSPPPPAPPPSPSPSPLPLPSPATPFR